MSVSTTASSPGSRATGIDSTLAQELAGAIRGSVIQPGDADFDGARSVWNAMIDRRPALIARCAGTADVVEAVRFARERGLELAVRGGGHNVAGSAVCDDGLVIDLSLMRGIQVDPGKRVARVQSGATWGDLNHETQLHGLVTPGGEVSTTGVAGFTLAGGMGVIRRKWGLTCDNLLSVEIVTADGEVLTASTTEHPDLFWAVRGGGGNFGVVTWFELQLHPLGPEVFSPALVYHLDDAPAMMRRWRDFVATAPDEVTLDPLFWTLPDLPDFPEDTRGMPIFALVGMYAGPADDGERALAPLQDFGAPVMDLGGRAIYSETQSMFDPFFPSGLRYYWKSLFMDEMSDETIERVVAIAWDRPTALSVMGIRHLRGAISNVPEVATAYGNRRATYNLSIDTSWEDPALDERAVEWTRRAWSELHGMTGGGVYLNFAGLGEDNDALARAGYGRNIERLRQVKRRYDPDNLFRGNVNIAP